VQQHKNRITVADRERLLGFLEGTGVSIPARAAGVAHPRRPRSRVLDGRKMSKSYGNTIGLREEPDQVVQKLRAMKTDPARVRRTDPGDPEKCPVVGPAQDLLRRGHPQVGERGFAAAPASVAWTASSR